MGLHGGLRPDLRGDAVSIDNALGLILSILVTVYLFYALIRAERF